MIQGGGRASVSEANVKLPTYFDVLFAELHIWLSITKRVHWRNHYEFSVSHVVKYFVYKSGNLSFVIVLD